MRLKYLTNQAPLVPHTRTPRLSDATYETRNASYKLKHILL